MPDKFLPLGSVVLLKGASKELMITGFAVKDTKGNTYDYCSCLFPEGILKSDQNALFNHDQIEKISFKGYDNEDSKDFRKKLKEFIEKDKKEEK